VTWLPSDVNVADIVSGGVRGASINGDDPQVWSTSNVRGSGKAMAYFWSVVSDMLIPIVKKLVL
jgi:hypothetical protein